MLKYLFRHFLENYMKQKNCHTDGDGAVRHIKSRPVQITDIKVKKINNLAETDSVYEVTHRTA
jgi:hypothetical protein